MNITDQLIAADKNFSEATRRISELQREAAPGSREAAAYEVAIEALTGVRRLHDALVQYLVRKAGDL
jgi:hypothetical protein